MENIKFDFVDKIGDIKVYWFKVEIENEKYIAKAKDIDGSNYDGHCFKIITIKNENDEFTRPQLLYISNDGCKNTITELMDNNLLKEIIKTIKDI